MTTEGRRRVKCQTQRDKDLRSVPASPPSSRGLIIGEREAWQDTWRMRIGFQSDDALLCRETMARCQEIVGWLRTGNVASSYSRCVMEYNRNMASEKYDDTRRSHFRRERGRERFVKRFFS